MTLGTEVDMSLRNAIAALALCALILPAASCERTGEVSSPDGGEVPLEERLEIECDEDAAPHEAAALIETESYPIFDAALLDLGYRIHAGDAAAYRARDPLTGDELIITIIPCLKQDDISRVAFVMYFRANEGADWAVTAAEYREEEGYDIPHPIDTADALAAGTRCSPESKERFVLMSETSSRYWKCVAKRFAAGCLGCATACYLSGPGWGACTATCCGGAAIASLAACAFTVFLGW